MDSSRGEELVVDCNEDDAAEVLESSSSSVKPSGALSDSSS